MIKICVCMYKMVVEIRKETWGKRVIKTVKHCNETEKITELWQKVSDLETQIKHSNICDIALKRIRKYCGKKKEITKEENKGIKHFLKVKQVFLLLKNLHLISLNVVNYQKPQNLEIAEKKKKKKLSSQRYCA